MRYLVTGGAGFIGSHLAEMLLERGDSVLVLDNFSTGRPENVEHLLADASVRDRIEVVEGSVLDEERVADAVGRTEVVVHLAASVGVQRIVQQPLESLRNNVRGTEVE